MSLVNLSLVIYANAEGFFSSRALRIFEIRRFLQVGMRMRGFYFIRGTGERRFRRGYWTVGCVFEDWDWSG